MVEIAQEAFQSQNFGLASEIYVRIIREKGPAWNLLVELGSCLALDGQISRAFTAFIKAYRLSDVDSKELTHLVNSLVNVTRDGMKRLSGGTSLLLETKAVLDCEPFLCGLCIGITLEPTTIYCGHTFCRRCLAKYSQNTCVSCGLNPPVANGFKQNIVLMDVMLKLFPHLNEILQLKSNANEKFIEERYEEAVQLYSKILDRGKGDHTIWSNRSYAYLKLGNYEQALKDAAMAIQFRPQWAKGYYRRGCAEESLGRTEESAISYMKCLALDGNCPQARGSLTEIIHNLLKPKMNEDLKHTPCTSKEPVSNLMEPDSSDDCVDEGLNKVKALLAKEFEEVDTTLRFETAVANVDFSPLTINMFDCSLCFRLLLNPVTTPCGHVFCQHCLERSMDHSVLCPQCRGDVSEYLAQRNRAITISLQRILTLSFPQQVEERKKLDQAELAAFSLSGAHAEIPIFVCTTAIPTIPCPLHVFEPKYRLMMRQVMESGVRQFGMCLAMPELTGDYATFGTMLEINDLKFFDDGRSVVNTVGERRFRVLSRSTRDGYDVAKVEFVDDVKVRDDQLPELVKLNDAVYQTVKDWLSTLPEGIVGRINHQYGNLPQRDPDIRGARLGPKWVWWVTAILPIEPKAQLSILQMTSLMERLTTIKKVINFLVNRQQ